MAEQTSLTAILVGPVTAASIAAVVALGLALAGPGRYYGWRLQKVLDLLGGMDDLTTRTRTCPNSVL
ncbi:hypothetical protein O4159_12930 [Gordonia terrae]|uniref:hypothetical protein n=1 Tax=Gordonia hongkongensis TaxID=1701090 RepID=UPI0022B4271D|nr:hypothetical protein [Gordonia terrae]